jgi:hypothetical protein
MARKGDAGEARLKRNFAGAAESSGSLFRVPRPTPQTRECQHSMSTSVLGIGGPFSILMVIKEPRRIEEFVISIAEYQTG